MRNLKRITTEQISAKEDNRSEEITDEEIDEMVRKCSHNQSYLAITEAKTMCPLRDLYII